MQETLPASTLRVCEAAREAGLDVRVRIMADSTRSAEEAARACGVTVGQIVKSLVFCGRESGRAYLLLVSGRNRVDEAAVAARLGEAIERPNARRVRDITGYAIGGIPPIGHATPVVTHMDPDLLAFDEVWAAAGTPSAVFPVAPGALRAATGAEVTPMTADQEQDSLIEACKRQ